MIRDGILKTKRYELGTVVAGRKRKLQELYHATVAFAGTESSHRDSDSDALNNHGEAAFLQANDIANGHYFDLSTLLHVTSSLRDYLRPSRTPSSAELASTPPTNFDNHTERRETPDTEHSAAIRSQQEPRRQAESESADVINKPPSKLVVLNNDVETLEKSLPDEDLIVVESALPNHLGVPKKPNDGGARLRSDLLTTAQHAVLAASKSPLPGNESSLPALTGPSASDTGIQLPPKAVQALQSAGNEIKTIESELTRYTTGTKRDLSTADSGPSESSLAKRRRGLSPGNLVVTTSGDTASQQSGDSQLPMRIDTNFNQHGSASDAGGASTSSTILKSAQIGIQSSPPDQMTTRVTTGAIRHRSVSDILAETPRSATAEHKSLAAKSDELKDIGTQTPRSGQFATSPDSVAFRSRLMELKEREKDRSKMSTVVFPRQPSKSLVPVCEQKIDDTRRREKIWEQKDYLVPLFAAQASAQNPTLSHLIASSSKTLSTNNHHLEYREAQDCRMLKRIYHLQNSNRWSLRQLERSKEPDRPVSHWDMLLREVKWLRTDFREERKWKLAAAKNLADWCAEWVNSPDEDRFALQVTLRKPQRRLSDVPENHVTPVSLPNGEGSSHSEPTPDLIPSTADDTSDSADEEMPHIDVTRTVAPAALFSLAPEDVLFGIHSTPATDKLLDELPLYRIYEDSRRLNFPCNNIPDNEWKKPIVPVSKFAAGKILMESVGPVRKRSRYQYAEEDEIDRDSFGHTLIPLEHSKEPRPPETDDVALFDPENKHIIARLHAAHAFRPPSEFNMPAQGFFESRTPSQWTVAEDDQLRRLVREYEYNWSLISACLSSPSLFSSGAERRTPWECFERWVSFEGLPGDMAKHQYFRAWNARREGAREHLEHLFEVQQQGSNGSQVLPRRKTAEPISVDRRRQSKYLSTVTAMYKIAKRREAHAQKQQHVASLAAMRKNVEPPAPRQRMQTPREFSAHKYKQECDFKEKQMLYRQQVAANQRAALAARAAQQAGQQQPNPAIPQAIRNGVPMPPSSTGNQLPAPPNGAPPTTHGMTNHAIMSLPNGTPGTNNPVNLRGAGPVSQAQMQAYMQPQQRLPSQHGQESARIIMEASRLSEQQRMMQQQRQFQATGLNGNLNMPLHNPAAFAGFQATNGKLSPSVNGNSTQNHLSTSPVASANNVTSQPTMVPMLKQAQDYFKRAHPNATPEQINHLVTKSLMERSQQPQTNGMAANPNGSGNMITHLLSSPLTLPQTQPPQLAISSRPDMSAQLYTQMMRTQAAQQLGRNGPLAINPRSSSPNVESNRPNSSSSTLQKASGVASGVGSSTSPRPTHTQAQVLGAS